MTYAFDEYKTLQDKLDKIGAFRFTIKGWSVTVVAAGLIAGVSNGKHLHILIAATLDVCLFWFYWFERQQVLLSWAFGQRARDIERHIDRTRKVEKWKNQFTAPHIAHLILNEKRPGFERIVFSILPFERYWRYFLKHAWRPFTRYIRKSHLSWIPPALKVFRKSDGIFYLFMCCLAWSPLLVKATPPDPPPSIINSFNSDPHDSNTEAQPAPDSVTKPAQDRTPAVDRPAKKDKHAK